MPLYWSVLKAVLLRPSTYSASYASPYWQGHNKRHSEAYIPRVASQKSVYTAGVLAKEAKAASTPASSNQSNQAVRVSYQ